MSTRNTYQVSTYLPIDVADQFKAVAERKKWSLANTLKQAVLAYLHQELRKSLEKV